MSAGTFGGSGWESGSFGSVPASTSTPSPKPSSSLSGSRGSVPVFLRETKIPVFVSAVSDRPSPSSSGSSESGIPSPSKSGAGGTPATIGQNPGQTVAELEVPDPIASVCPAETPLLRPPATPMRAGAEALDVDGAQTIVRAGEVAGDGGGDGHPGQQARAGHASHQQSDHPAHSPGRDGAPIMDG